MAQHRHLVGVFELHDFGPFRNLDVQVRWAAKHQPLVHPSNARSCYNKVASNGFPICILSYHVLSCLSLSAPQLSTSQSHLRSFRPCRVISPRSFGFTLARRSVHGAAQQGLKRSFMTSPLTSRLALSSSRLPIVEDTVQSSRGRRRVD
jgi:hypothetical protein